MTSRLTATAASAVILAATAFGSMAADGADGCRMLLDRETGVETGVEVCTEQVWFHAASSPIGNLAAAGAGTPTFDTTEPGSGGGGYLTTSALHQNGSPHDPVESATFTGTLEGALDNLVVSMYLMPPAGVAQGETVYRVDAQLTIDGTVVAFLDDKNVPMVADGSLQRVDFGWINIDTRATKLGIDLAASHQIELSFHGTGIGTNGAVVAFDSTDFPSGMVFNVPVEDLEDKIMGRA